MGSSGFLPRRGEGALLTSWGACNSAGKGRARSGSSRREGRPSESTPKATPLAAAPLAAAAAPTFRTLISPTGRSSRLGTGAPEPSGGVALRHGARRGRRGGGWERGGRRGREGRAGPRLLLQLRLLLNAAAAHPPALAPAARLSSGLARLCARLRCARLGLAASLVHASTSPLASCTRRGGRWDRRAVRHPRWRRVCSWQSRTVLAAAALLLLGRGRLS